MGQRYVKQTDGRYAIYSTNSDQLIGWNCTWQDLVDYEVERATKRAKESMAGIKAKEPESPDGAPRYLNSWMQQSCVLDSANMHLGARTDDGEFNRGALATLEPTVALLKKIFAGEWEESDGDISDVMYGKKE